MAARLLPILLAALPALAADWNPRAAAEFLDARQKQWFDWPRANENARPCVSCHTGMTYLLARPVLRRILGEAGPTRYETGLLDSLRARLAKREPSDLYPKAAEPHRSESAAAESIFAAFFLRTPEAIDRMWVLQRPDGAWAWPAYDLDPWEMPDSTYFGAALAAAVFLPEAYSSPAITRLGAYLERGFAAQPLQNRLQAIRAAAAPRSAYAATLDEAWRKQSPDGSWTLEALGPWKTHDKAPSASGSNAYATAFAAAMLRPLVPASDPRIARALAWLAAHQGPKGYWDAASMNKVYAPDSIPAGFMRDAATAFAVMALAGPH